MRAVGKSPLSTCLRRSCCPGACSFGLLHRWFQPGQSALLRNLQARICCRKRTRGLILCVMCGKVRDGLLATIQTVRSRLDQPTALGYSSTGTVILVADDVTDIHAGDRVACAGANLAVHAEIASVPRLLVARIPEDSSVTFEDAAFYNGRRNRATRHSSR